MIEEEGIWQLGIYNLVRVGFSCAGRGVVYFDLLDPKTPVPNSHGQYFGSPEIEYFRMPPRTRQASRWKEDWEELELLVGFPSLCSNCVLMDGLNRVEAGLVR